MKGRAKGAEDVTITRNEIMYGLNQGDKFVLAIVWVDGETVDGPHYIDNPFRAEPTSSKFKIADLLGLT